MIEAERNTEATERASETAIERAENNRLLKTLSRPTPHARATPLMKDATHESDAVRPSSSLIHQSSSLL